MAVTVSEAGEDGVAVPFAGETLSQEPPKEVAGLAVKESEPPPPSHIYSKWWFWTSVGVALAAGGAAAWWFTRPENQVPSSTYGAIRVSP